MRKAPLSCSLGENKLKHVRTTCGPCGGKNFRPAFFLISPTFKSSKPNLYATLPLSSLSPSLVCNSPSLRLDPEKLRPALRLSSATLPLSYATIPLICTPSLRPDPENLMPALRPALPSPAISSLPLSPSLPN